MPNRSVRECIRRGEPLVGRSDHTVRQAAMSMVEASCGSILICEGDRLRGIFTERDLLVRVVAAGLDPDETAVEQVMTANPETIDAAAPVIEAIRRMDEFAYRHMPVLDDGRIVGVISWRDLPFEDRAGSQPELELRHSLAERMW